MTSDADRVAAEMAAVEMEPSRAAAVFGLLMTYQASLVAKGDAATAQDRYMIRALHVQGDAFRAAGVLWTEAMDPATLAAMDAQGPIAVALAMPQSVLLCMAADGAALIPADTMTPAVLAYARDVIAAAAEVII